MQAFWIIEIWIIEIIHISHPFNNFRIESQFQYFHVIGHEKKVIKKKICEYRANNLKLENGHLNLNNRHPCHNLSQFANTTFVCVCVDPQGVLLPPLFSVESFSFLWKIRKRFRTSFFDLKRRRKRIFFSKSNDRRGNLLREDGLIELKKIQSKEREKVIHDLKNWMKWIETIFNQLETRKTMSGKFFYIGVNEFRIISSFLNFNE